MRKRDLRFASWIIAITSMLYSIVSLTVAGSNGYSDGFYGGRIISEHSLYYIPILLLVIFGVSKIVGLITANKTIRRFSIVGLMFCWGFVWISSLLNFIAVSPNRTTITTIPIIAISIFIATRGDYTDD